MTQILSIEKLIPSYQRNFVWDGDLRDSFLENLVEAHNEGAEYFIGSMVFRQLPDGAYEVVDGQQRITTMYILFSSALKVATELEGKYQDHFLKLRGKLGSSILKNNEPVETPLLRHADKTINKAYESLAKRQDIQGADSESKMLRNLDEAQADAIKFLEKYLEDQPQKDAALAGFLDFIEKKVVCIHHVADDLATALTIYSRLNSTGRSLGNMEILKGLSFVSAERNESWEQLETCWSELENAFYTPIKFGGKGRERQMVPDNTLLSYFFFLEHPDLGLACKGDDFLGANALSDVILDDQISLLLSKNAAAFVNSIKEFALEMKSLREGTIRHQSSERIENYLLDIASIAQTQSQWLLVGIPLLKHFPRATEAFRALRNMVFVFSFALTGSGTASGVFRALARKLNEKHLRNEPCQENLEEVIADMKTQIFKYFPAFRYEVENLSYKNTSDRKLIRRVFEYMEAELWHDHNMGAVQNLMSLYNKKGINIDHLQPTKIEALDLHNQHGIGNLALLHESTNKAIGKQAFEDEEKQEHLRSSEFIVTKAIAFENLKGGLGKAVQNFTRRKTLTDQDVQDRQEELLNFLQLRLL